jgi:hypothetical protein
VKCTVSAESRKNKFINKGIIEISEGRSIKPIKPLRL